MIALCGPDVAASSFCHIELAGYPSEFFFAFNCDAWDLDRLYFQLTGHGGVGLGNTDGEDAVFNFGFGAIGIYFDGENNGARERAPVAFLVEIVLLDRRRSYGGVRLGR